MSLSRLYVIIIGLAAAVPAVFAQDTESDAASDRKQYRVEVITFQYLGPDTAAGEQFDGVHVQRYLPSDSFDIDEYNRIRETVSYTGLARLSSALDKLRSHPYYSVLSTAGWVQPLLSPGEAVAVPLGESGQSGADAAQSGSTGSARAQVSGTLSVYGGRLLYASLDLEATLPGQSASGQAAGGSSTATRSRSLSETAAGAGIGAFRLAETRRIKLNQYHYFDHPYMGAIVSVSRHE